MFTEEDVQVYVCVCAPEPPNPGCFIALERYPVGAVTFMLLSTRGVGWVGGLFLCVVDMTKS